LPGPDFKRPFPAVFIRAPAITKVWGKCRALATVDKYIVLAEQDGLVAAAFHPELTSDTRIHERLLEKV
jgi:5'-phosphate synthase pdxT subunit